MFCAVLVQIKQLLVFDQISCFWGRDLRYHALRVQIVQIVSPIVVIIHGVGYYLQRAVRKYVFSKCQIHVLM